MTVDERIRERRIGILGMARSGMAVARLVKSRGGLPFVSESRAVEAVTEQAGELRSLDIVFETGGHTDRLLECDYLVVSPGVPLGLDILERARSKGLPIFSELEVGSWVCPGRMVAITGTNGKTTTTTLIGEILTVAGLDTHVCGNIGRPLAEVVGQMTEQSVAVIEVSSFQLETISEFRPHLAIILNLTPDHIDRHGSFEAYKNAKYRITENQSEQEVFILNREDNELIADHPASLARRLFFSSQDDPSCAAYVSDNWLCVTTDDNRQRVIAVNDIAIKGPHNLQNSAAAVTVAAQLGVAPETMAQVLASFAGVEHRLEPAGVVAGVSFINDSKATNVDSVMVALRSVGTPIYLILGGRDKGGQFEFLAEPGKDRIKSIVAIGEAKEKIFESLGKSFPTEFSASLEEAVAHCFKSANPGDTVLLSPGCASFDMFDNYEERGRAFKAAVISLKTRKKLEEPG